MRRIIDAEVTTLTPVFANRVHVLTHDADAFAQYRAAVEESINPSGEGQSQWQIIEMCVLFFTSVFACTRISR